VSVSVWESRLQATQAVYDGVTRDFSLSR